MTPGSGADLGRGFACPFGPQSFRPCQTSLLGLLGPGFAQALGLLGFGPGGRFCLGGGLGPSPGFNFRLGGRRLLSCSLRLCRGWMLPDALRRLVHERRFYRLMVCAGPAGKGPAGDGYKGGDNRQSRYR